MKFSLITEPWIPTIDVNGKHCDVSLAEVFSRTDLADITAPTPHETVALYRLLDAIYARAHGLDLGFPEDIDIISWVTRQLDLSKTGPDTVVLDYLHKWEHRFNLFDDTRPFMQAAGFVANSKDHKFYPPAMILTAETKNPQFGSRTDDRPFTPAEAACALVAHQSFVLGGRPTGGVRAPGAQPKLNEGMDGWLFHTNARSVVTLVSDSLRRSIALTTTKSQLTASAMDDLPSWERPAEFTVDNYTTDKVEVVPTGPNHIFTHTHRAVTLYEEDGMVVGAVSGLRYPLMDTVDPYNKQIRYIDHQSPQRRVTRKNKDTDAEETIALTNKSIFVDPGLHVVRDNTDKDNMVKDTTYTCTSLDFVESLILGWDDGFTRVIRSSNMNGSSGKVKYIVSRPECLDTVVALSTADYDLPERLTLRVTGARPGPKQAIFLDSRVAELSLPVALLSRDAELARSSVAHRARQLQRIAREYARFRGNVLISGGARVTIAPQVTARFSDAVDQPFRRFIAQITADNYVDVGEQWVEELRGFCRGLAREDYRSASIESHLGRLKDPGDPSSLMNASKALGFFFSAVDNILATPMDAVAVGDYS